MVTQAICHLDDRNYPKIKILAEVFSTFSLTKYRLQTEIFYLLKLSEFKIIRSLTTAEQKFLRQLIDRFDEHEFEQINQIEQKVNHDVKAVEIYLRAKLAKSSLSDLESMVHFGSTSEDTNNLSYGIQLLAAKKIIVAKLTKIIGELTKVAQETKGVVMCARTHGQIASPTTFGKEVMVFVSRLRSELKIFATNKLEGKFNGSVGNYNALALVFPQVDWLKFSRLLVSDLGLKPNLITTQILPYDSWIRDFDSLKRINEILLGLVQDWWLYVSFGYLKLKNIKSEVGSSSMPHKINPIDLEAAEGNLGLANSLLEFLGQKLAKSRLQRDLSDSSVRRNVGLSLAYGFLAYDSISRALARLKPDEEAMTKEVLAHPEVLAEAYQNFWRFYKLEGDYEIWKNLTRGQQIDQAQISQLIDQTTLPAKTKNQLKNLQAINYLGLAKKLAGLKI